MCVMTQTGAGGADPLGGKDDRPRRQVQLLDGEREVAAEEEDPNAHGRGAGFFQARSSALKKEKKKNAKRARKEGRKEARKMCEQFEF